MKTSVLTSYVSELGDKHACAREITGAASFVCLQLILISSVGAQTADAVDNIFGDLEITSYDGRQDLLVLPSRPGIWESNRASAKSFTLEILEFEDRRRHFVTLGDKTYQSSTPLEGTWSRIAFDLERKRFIGILPSIRIEFVGREEAELVAETVSARRVTMFQKLGFYIVELPEELHPLEAINAIRRLPGQPKATVRARRFKVEWR